MQFNERKVAQTAAYLLSKSGGRMSHLKLMKLLYLADRESMDRYEEPISGDYMVSMPHGPVLSSTLDLMDGAQKNTEAGWSYWVSDKANHEVALRRNIENLDQLGALSESEIEILDYIWGRFGGLDRWAIRDWTHNNCSEWVDPHGSAYPISYRDLFVALGRDPSYAATISSEIEGKKLAHQILASL